MAENTRQAKAAELHQRSVELWLAGKRDDAIAVYREALALETDAISLQLRDTLPNSYSDPDATPHTPINLQQQNAFTAYRNTVRLTTDDARAWFNIGLTHEKEGLAAEAGQAYVESFKSYHRTHAAKTLQTGGKAAVEVCRRMTEIDPKDAKAWFNLGVLQGKLGNPHGKIRSYQKAVEADPNFGEGWHNLGVMLNAVGKTEEGDAAFARARKLLNPKFRIAETIEFRSATTPDGAPTQPTSAPPV